jgi:hypothetical protein
VFVKSIINIESAVVIVLHVTDWFPWEADCNDNFHAKKFLGDCFGITTCGREGWRQDWITGEVSLGCSLRECLS